jgi:hypothetical protein
MCLGGLEEIDKNQSTRSEDPNQTLSQAHTIPSNLRISSSFTFNKRIPAFGTPYSSETTTSELGTQ